MGGRDVRSTCDGKTPYCTKGAAIERIKGQRKRKRFNRNSGSGWWRVKVLSPYRCPFCHHWHVGATDKDNVRRY